MNALILRLVAVVVLFVALPAIAANVVTVQILDAEPGDASVRVDVYAANGDDLLEYFNLLVFDASRLVYVDLVADRGVLWYGLYPTRVEGDHVYVHGWSGGFSECIDPVAGTPGPALYHLLFDVKSDAPDGLATIAFAADGAFDGHWNDCTGYGISPAPTYHAGGVQVQASTGVDGGTATGIATRAYPNPATGGARISFVLPMAGGAEITVYDLTGRRVRTVATGVMAAGPHDVRWDGADDLGRPAPAGVYFCRVRSAAGTAVDKIMLVR